VVEFLTSRVVGAQDVEEGEGLLLELARSCLEDGSVEVLIGGVEEAVRVKEGQVGED